VGSSTSTASSAGPGSPPSDLAVEVIESEAATEPVLDRWRELAELRGSAFVSPEWLLLSRRHLDPGSELAVAVARDGAGTCVGLLPWLRHPGSRGVRLGFAGIGVGDVLEPLADPGHEQHVAAACARALGARFGRRATIALGCVESDARWWEAVARAWPGRLGLVAQPEEGLPYIDLAGTDWETYLAGRSRQFRSQYGRKMRTLRREHGVELRRASADTVAADVETLLDLHARRWAGLEGVSALADPRVHAFHRELAPTLLDRGWLRLFVIEIDGSPAAAWYGWRLGGRYSYYQAGFDPAWSRQSIGFLLLAETVRMATEEGVDEYDLLLGEEAFKARFATGRRACRRVLLAPRTSRAYLSSAAASRLRSGVRALPQPLRERLRSIRRRAGG